MLIYECTWMNMNLNGKEIFSLLNLEGGPTFHQNRLPEFSRFRSDTWRSLSIKSDHRRSESIRLDQDLTFTFLAKPEFLVWLFQWCQCTEILVITSLFITLLNLYWFLFWRIYRIIYRLFVKIDLKNHISRTSFLISVNCNLCKWLLDDVIHHVILFFTYLVITFLDLGYVFRVEYKLSVLLITK